MLLASAATSLGYDGPGDFAMETDGRLVRRGERADGAVRVHRRLDRASAAVRRRAARAVLAQRAVGPAIDNGRLFGIRLDGLWMHVGTPEALVEAERWIESEDVA